MKSMVATKVSVLVATLSVAVAQVDQRSVKSYETIFSHGAKCDGNGANAEVDTAAAEAIATSGQDIYIPANNYCIFKRPIELNRPGQRILGDGPAVSKILIYNVFGNHSGDGFDKGVLNLEAPGQEIRGIGLSFRQPAEPKRRSDLITYQPAIRARQPATSLQNLLVAGATTCIDMGGNANAGNSRLSEIGTGCFDYGIRLDGALDTVSVRNHHSFPFQMTPAQSAIFQRAENVSIDLGRVDDYAIEGGLCLGQTCINFFDGAQGGAFGTVTGYDFDGAAIGIHMRSRAAALTGSALSFSAGMSSQHAIVQSSGRLIIAASSFYAQAPTVLDHFTGGVQTIIGSEWNLGKSDMPAIVSNASAKSNAPAPNATSSSASRLTLVGNTIERDSDVSLTAPWLEADGREIIVGSQNSVTSSTRGGVFVSIAEDVSGNRWIGNSSPGWSSYVAKFPMPDSVSATAGGGRYFGN